MAKIFISHTPADKTIAHEIGGQLALLGYDFYCNRDTDVAGAAVADALDLTLRECIGAIVISGNEAATLRHHTWEIDFLINYAKKNTGFAIIPVRLPGAPFIDSLSRILHLIADDEDTATTIATQIVAALTKLRSIGALSTLKEEQKEQAVRSVRDYVKEATDDLKLRESAERRAAQRNAILGYSSLVISAAVGVVGMIQASAFASMPWHASALHSFKFLVAIASLVGTSRVAFGYSRAHMSEALRNANRVHAIAFGKFLHGVYGEQLKPQDVRRAFQDWNINTPSAFSEFDTTATDPKVTNVTTKLARALHGLLESPSASTKRRALKEKAPNRPISKDLRAINKKPPNQ